MAAPQFDDEFDDPLPAPFGTDDLLDRVARFFGPETPLRRSSEVGGRPYEERPQQGQMALSIAHSLVEGEHLCVEAPTGVGKSFAYLIPAIYLARAQGRPVVVSTHTIALQEQLIERDLPVLQNLLDEPFTAVLAKGRANYVCRSRLEKAGGDAQEEYLPSADLVPEVQRIARWLETTRDGSRSDLDFRPNPMTWSSVCSEPGVCKYEQDGDSSKCFFLKARRRLFKADIIVCNHALLCVDLAMREESNGEQSLLPKYQAVILDEAHTFEDVAASHLGLRISSYAASSLLQRLYNPQKNRGLLARAGLEVMQQAATQAIQQTQSFFERVANWIEQQSQGPLRYTSAGHIPNQLAPTWQPLLAQLKELGEDEGLDRDYTGEVRAIQQRLQELLSGFETFLQMQLADHVYWLEVAGRYRNVICNASPIDVSGTLSQVLFDRDFTVIMTSATLAVRRDDMTYVTKRIGAQDARQLVLPSPFDFSSQVDLYVPFNDMPHPNETEKFLEQAVVQIRKFLLKTEGKAFVLFTSYSAMNTVAKQLESFFVHNQLTLLVQGRELQRSRMLEVFRSDINSVIFGTDSFWMGVDVPGEALSNVIIVKLPFPSPAHPLIAARKAYIDDHGGNSFRDYFLPEAVLKFRQGIGRLIRSREDHGIIVVLDPRIIRSSYGVLFLESIPDCRRHIF